MYYITIITYISLIRNIFVLKSLFYEILINFVAMEKNRVYNYSEKSVIILL